MQLSQKQPCIITIKYSTNNIQKQTFKYNTNNIQQQIALQNYTNNQVYNK